MSTGILISVIEMTIRYAYNLGHSILDSHYAIIFNTMKKLLILIFFIFSQSHFVSCFSQVSQLDITGNWCEFDSFLPYIQISEPDVKTTEVRIFKQSLKLPEGKYTIEFRYDQNLDNIAGKALMQDYRNFTGFKVNGTIIPLNFLVTSNAKNEYSSQYSFVLPNMLNNLNLELSLSTTRPIQTLLTVPANIPESKKFYGVYPDSEKKTTAIIHGIPFVLNELSCEHIPAGICFFKNPSPICEWKNGMRIKYNNTKVDVIHFLGMVQQYDIANGSWYSPKGDQSYSHFAGDTTGIINVSFTDGKKLQVPLIYGFNFWYGRPWDILWFYKPYSLKDKGENYDAQLFSGENKYRNIIRDGVKLVDGYRMIGGHSNNARYIFSLNLYGKSIETIEITSNDKMKGIPIISAVTIEADHPVSGLCPLPDVSSANINTNPVTPEIIEKVGYKHGVDNIMHTLYTFVDEHPKLKEPEIPTNYFGPKYDFRGTQEAVYAASYMYKNGLECGAKIGDRGTGCASSTARSAIAHYTLGMGVWYNYEPVFRSMDNWIKLYHECIPGKLGGTGVAWSRGIGELMREAMALGYNKFMDKSIDWLDSCLFADANPPHWIRIVGVDNLPGIYVNRKVGKIIETGNRENDGHGICMWGRYMVYHWMGRPLEWNQKRWKATEAAVTWIKWQLDSDTIFPGKRKDILFTESECAHSSYDIYSSFNCLHGIKLYIRMAEQLGKTGKVNEWTVLYNRLRNGILENLVDSSEYGTIWHTERQCDWQDHAHKLVHLQLATEGDTYTPLQDYATGNRLDRKYLDIDINTYNFLMKDRNYNCLRMYGYGQGMMTQSALLLDQMQDATEFINLMVTYAYLPKLDGWTAPEGIIVHKSGKYYLPVNGYLGQDSHLADSQKALRLMLGIDDNNPGHLRIIPRFPADWSRISIADYPVLTGGKRQKCSYSYIRDNKQQTFQIKFEEPVNNFSVRLGPLPADKTIKKVSNKKEEIQYHILDSGDSRWIWVENINGIEVNIKILFESLQ